MIARDRKLAAGASMLVTLSVAVNMVAFQGRGQAPGAEAPDLASRTAWVDGPGIVLGPTAPGPGAPATPGGATIATGVSDDINAAEITRGIQRELNSRNYYTGQPDGVAGLVTRAAIFAYEYDNGLVLTGRPSEPLLTQIILGSSSLTQSTSRPGRTMTSDGESLVRNVKQQLSALGYQTGVPGGALTPEFARAIREFEADQKLSASGRISAPMVGRLIRLQGDGKARAQPAARTATHEKAGSGKPANR
jgi:peptidoglycan hydrolase-like protein with peptidoglycan-binding domain